MTSDELMLLIKEKLIPDMYIFPNRFNPIDGYWEQRDMAIEVKVKNDFFQDVYIEKHKWESMLEYSNKRYINYMRLCTGKELIYSFNLNTIPEPQWELVEQPNASNELYTGWVLKQMGRINIRQGKNITHLLLN
ncbi:hypothetical protein UFOVP187_32 [uncultured Caudovirales phage]|uniref:Uncharacterized protein n=1 Tax=uncultured Caudovirales phage TaxID=2100421 RepID=A0A6J7WK97_9CAUD|nr:hypothetical protein UFOVP187_32 [uncultured Caudovirales phage]